METLRLIAGPLIGAVIGYCTNYIAVKMLFYPRKPIKIGNFTLPFTPGIIPKRKEVLGHAIGEMVGNSLVTAEDLENVLLSDKMKHAVLDGIWKKDKSLNEMGSEIAGEETWTGITAKAENVTVEKIMDALDKANVGKIIADEGIKAVKEKVQGSMLALMVNDAMLQSFAEPMEEKINQYILTNGEIMIAPLVHDEVSSLLEQSPQEMCEGMNVETEAIDKAIGRVYQELIEQKAPGIIEQFQISSIIEEKIDAMDVVEIEKMVLLVMKHELDAIVNLGAVIGFVLGLVMIFVK